MIEISVRRRSAPIVCGMIFMKTHVALKTALLAADLIFKAALLAAVFILPAAAQDARDPTGPYVPPPGNPAYNKTAIIGVEAGASHVRLANLRDEAVRNHVEIYGLGDRHTLGSFTLDVPAKGSVQFQPETMIESFAPLNWNQPIVLYVENGRDKQLWQHVKLRRSGLTDASVCATPPHLDYAPVGNVALNIFAGHFSRYTSLVTAHNFSDQAGEYEVHVYDAATGSRLALSPVTIKARESFSRDGTWFASLIQTFAPADEQRPLNVEFVLKQDTGARIVVAHTVRDVFTGDAVNLSNPCAIHGGIVTILELPQP